MSPRATSGPTFVGNIGEAAARSKLWSMGISVRRRNNSSHDLLVGDVRVEVKYAKYSMRNGLWKVNIHRHGLLDESGVDVYFFVLAGLPGVKYLLYVLLPAPLRKYTMEFSVHTLIKKYAYALEDWALLNRNNHFEIDKGPSSA